MGRAVASILLFVLSSLMLRCGDDGGPTFSLPPISSDGDKQVSEISEAEAQVWCQAWGSEIEEAVPLENSCTLAARVSAGLKVQLAGASPSEYSSLCHALLQGCLDGSGEISIVEAPGFPCTLDGKPTGTLAECHATVDEYDSCMNAAINFYSNNTSKGSCDTLYEETTSTPASGGDECKSVPKCAALKAKCPQMVSGIDTGSCGGSGSPNVGVWKGPGIHFEVTQESTIKIIEVILSADTSECTSTVGSSCFSSSKYTGNAGDPGIIVDSSFSMELYDGEWFKGSFTSSSTASGQYHMAAEGECECAATATWTAELQ